MSGAPSQNDRVLARLRLGPVAAVEFQPPNICDGGTPVWRVAARVDVLKQRGFVIDSERRPDGTAVYRLVAEPASHPSGQPNDRVPDAAAAGDADPGSLFDASAFGTTGGYHDVAA